MQIPYNKINIQELSKWRRKRNINKWLNNFEVQKNEIINSWSWILKRNRIQKSFNVCKLNLLWKSFVNFINGFFIKSEINKILNWRIVQFFKENKCFLNSYELQKHKKINYMCVTKIQIPWIGTQSKRKKIIVLAGWLEECYKFYKNETINIIFTFIFN